jgi:capsular exopolysaccharide synthesis family protein
MRSFENYEIIPPETSVRQSIAPRVDTLAFQEHDYTWEQVIRVLRKRARFALLLAGGLTGLVLVYASLQKDFYRPTARLEMAPPGSGINTLHEIESTPGSDNQDYLETQVQILGSDALAASVIRELHLDQNPEFVSPKQVKDSSAGHVSGPPGTFLPEFAILREQLDLATLTPAESVALEGFRRSLSVNSVRNTRLVEVSFASHDPNLAQLIANTLVTKFIDQNYKHRYTSTMQASEWLSSQLNDLRTKVEESAQAVAEYQKKYGLVEVDDRDVPISGLMSDVNHQVSEAQANRIEDEAFVRMIDEGQAEAVPALRDDKLYQDLMGHYADLRTQLAQTKAVYGDENLNVKKLQDQLTEVSVQIDAERQRAIARARSTYAAARNREELMTREREKVRAEMGQMSSELTSYHMLKTEANASAELYNTLQGRLREAGIYAGLRSSNIRVVDLAGNLRKPTGPHRVLLVTLGAFASCLFAVSLSFLRESFRNTARTPDDVRAWVGLPSLALLPAMNRAETAETLHADSGAKLAPLLGTSTWEKSDKANLRIGIAKPATVLSEAMRDLRTALVRAKSRNAPGVILVSSSMEGEGKTTVAVNFAAALSQLGNTCLLEADLRQPAVSRVLQFVPLGGLTDVLKRSIPLSRALVHFPGLENLAVLPCGTIPENPADILSSTGMIELLRALKEQFDYVVIDSAPVIRFSDARFLSSLADKVVLVARYGVTTRRAMRRTIELLREMNAPIAGVVLNGIDLTSPDYHYYTYGYSSWKPKRMEAVLETDIGMPRPDGDDKPPKVMSASS